MQLQGQLNQLVAYANSVGGIQNLAPEARMQGAQMQNALAAHFNALQMMQKQHMMMQQQFSMMQMQMQQQQQQQQPAASTGILGGPPATAQAPAATAAPTRAKSPSKPTTGARIARGPPTSATAAEVATASAPAAASAADAGMAARRKQAATGQQQRRATEPKEKEKEKEVTKIAARPAVVSPPPVPAAATPAAATPAAAPTAAAAAAPKANPLANGPRLSPAARDAVLAKIKAIPAAAEGAKGLDPAIVQLLGGETVPLVMKLVQAPANLQGVVGKITGMLLQNVEEMGTDAFVNVLCNPVELHGVVSQAAAVLKQHGMDCAMAPPAAAAPATAAPAAGSNPNVSAEPKKAWGTKPAAAATSAGAPRQPPLLAAPQQQQRPSGPYNSVYRAQPQGQQGQYFRQATQHQHRDNNGNRGGAYLQSYTSQQRQPYQQQRPSYQRAPMLPPNHLVLTSALGTRIQPGRFRGLRYMREGDVFAISRMMYNGVVNAFPGADPFTEAYYAFALKAKNEAAAVRAATAAANPNATPSAGEGGDDASANVLDVGVVLLNMATASAVSKGKAAGRKTAPGKAADGATASADANADDKAKKPADAEAAPAASVTDAQTGADAARIASVIASLPVSGIYQRTMSVQMAQSRRRALASRRKWEESNSVLGRIVTSNVRAPRLAVNLSASGVTTATDLYRNRLVTTAAADKSAPGDNADNEEEEKVAAARDRRWMARARMDMTMNVILRLQDTARKLQAYLRMNNPPARPEFLNRWRGEVSRHRSALAAALGLRKGDEEAYQAAEGIVDTLEVTEKIVFRPLRDDEVEKAVAAAAAATASAGEEKLEVEDAPTDGAVPSSADAEGESAEAAPGVVPARPEEKTPPGMKKVIQRSRVRTPLPVPPTVPLASPSESLDDDVILALLSLPKGKRALCRALPMLHPADRVTAVAAGMRHLPHFVASAVAGTEAEEADAALSAALAKWIKTTMPVPGAAGGPLSILCQWVAELHLGHTGPIIRALLQHPGASDAISALLFRGEALAKAQTPAEDAAPPAEGDIAAETSAKEVAAWAAVTEALGTAFAEAE
jgi:hypothetical protein